MRLHRAVDGSQMCDVLYTHTHTHTHLDEVYFDVHYRFMDGLRHKITLDQPTNIPVTGKIQKNKQEKNRKYYQKETKGRI